MEEGEASARCHGVGFEGTDERPGAVSIICKASFERDNKFKGRLFANLHKTLDQTNRGSDKPSLAYYVCIGSPLRNFVYPKLLRT